MRRGDIVWGLTLAGVAAFIALPGSRGLFIQATKAYPFAMGFLKFAILATMGEFLAIRILKGRYEKPSGLPFKALVWGIIGILITFMFQLYGLGVAGLVSLGWLPSASGFFGSLLTAFFTSALMNLSFGPVFMACHRISDTWIETRASGEKPGMDAILARIDWPGFLKFVVGKTIPLFWIPAHTLTFMLPGEYRVLVAAFLSIALGALLSFAKARKA